MKKLILALAIISNFAFAENAWDLKCNNKELWDLVEKHHKKSFENANKFDEVKTHEIIFLKEEKKGEDLYFCWYKNKTHKREHDLAMKLEKIDNNTMEIEFATKRYKLTF